MEKLDSYDNFVNEGIVDYLSDSFYKIKDSISKLYDVLRKKISKNYEIETIKNTIIEDLKEFRDQLLKNPKEINQMNISRMLKSLEKHVEKKVLIDLNLDTFFRGLYTVTIKKKNRAGKIQDYFDSYIDTLPDRIDMVLRRGQTDKEKYKDDELFDELRRIQAKIKPKLGRIQFEKELRVLQLELLKMQEWLKTSNKSIVLLFEGRDAAGKGSTIGVITQYLDPKWYKVSRFGIPTEEEKQNWFQRYEIKLPEKGRMTLYDRSWYNRAVVDPVMGYCTEEQYRDFMEKVLPFEYKIIDDENILIKFWLSITKEGQEIRFQARKANPLKYWKFSPNDEATLTKWDIFTNYKEQMFERTSTEKSPWVVVDTNDKRTAQLNLVRYILDKVPYANKKQKLLDVYPEVVYEML
jgi:polyphosphate kinase 2